MSAKGYEPRDARPLPLLAAGVGLLVLMGLGLLVALGVDALFGAATSKERHPMADFREPPAGPRLQADPPVQMEQHRAWEQEMLNTYGWLDPKDGIVRIPIQQAMQRVLEEGFPVREEEKR